MSPSRYEWGGMTPEGRAIAALTTDGPARDLLIEPVFTAAAAGDETAGEHLRRLVAAIWAIAEQALEPLTEKDRAAWLQRCALKWEQTDLD
jgi:hypothetical protein